MKSNKIKIEEVDEIKFPLDEKNNDKIYKACEVKINLNGEIGILKSKNRKIYVIPDEVCEKLKKEFEIPDLQSLWLLEFEKYEFEGENGWRIIQIGNLKYSKEEENMHYKKSDNKKIKTIIHKFPFENYIGKSEIIFENQENKKPVRIPIEVISIKLLPEYNNTIDTSSPLFYPRFFKNIVREIWDLISALPFNIETPTFISTSLSARPTHPVFVFFFLKNYQDELKWALNVIRANPYRILSEEEEEFLTISEVSEMDSNTIYNIITHPEYLHDTTETGKGFLASLQSSERYYLPLKVLQPVKYETLDTPENRFVLYFVRLLLQDIEKLKEKYIAEIKDLKGELEDFTKDPLWEEVGELTIFPSTSTVLRMRDGYRELFSLYLKYLFARAPFEKIGEAIDMRKICDLYEFWCALKLCQFLDLIIKDNKLVTITSEKDIPERLNISINSIFEYQESKKSYTQILLVPDFTIRYNDKLIILDAKFAFDLKKVIDMQKRDRANKDELEEAQEKNIFPKTGDIVKMHAYKDALKADACLILYPGQDCKFYMRDGKEKGYEEIEEELSEGWKKIKRTFEEKKIEIGKNTEKFLKVFLYFLNSQSERRKIDGIGWIPLLPEGEKKENENNDRK